jgi:hypothetical protein
MEISVHHGPNGALSLIHSSFAVGGLYLHDSIGRNYPELVDDFHFASSALILAATICTKSVVIVYKNFDTVPQTLRTYAMFENDFKMDPQRTIATRR